RVGKKSGKQFNRILANSSLVGDPAWFDRDQFPWMKTLEDSWEIVRREARFVSPSVPRRLEICDCSIRACSEHD
ncbi:MAG: hypothetical protein VCE43_04350, partial [Myxococcota bacterium]